MVVKRLCYIGRLLANPLETPLASFARVNGEWVFMAPTGRFRRVDPRNNSQHRGPSIAAPSTPRRANVRPNPLALPAAARRSHNLYDSGWGTYGGSELEEEPDDAAASAAGEIDPVGAAGPAGAAVVLSAPGVSAASAAAATTAGFATVDTVALKRYIAYVRTRNAIVFLNKPADDVATVPQRQCFIVPEMCTAEHDTAEVTVHLNMV